MIASIRVQRAAESLVSAWDECTGEFDQLATELTDFVVASPHLLSALMGDAIPSFAAFLGSSERIPPLDVTDFPFLSAIFLRGKN